MSIILSSHNGRTPPNSGHSRANAYRFTRLSTSLFIQDLGFSKSDARPGTIVENVRIERLDGTPATLDEVVDGRPLLIVFGSVTCPMTFGAVDVLRRLHDEFGDTVKFAMLNVREAHPGENLEQPQSREVKHEHAKLLAAATSAPWETLVDTIDGDLHRRLAEKPNAAFLLAPNRMVLFRSLWGGDESGLREALRAVSGGIGMPKRQSTAALGPLGLGLGFFTPILERSGRRAKRELLLAAPPVAAFAALASVLGPLPLFRRGAAAIALSAAASMAAVLAMAWALYIQF